MSHQTGIAASEDLKMFLATAMNGSIRAIKVGIVNEELVLLDKRCAKGTYEDDFDESVLALVEHKAPCYIFYRLDSQNNLGYEWLFIPYSPDDSQVRQKMLYAGTRSTVKMEFGTGRITEELFGTTLDDINLDGYKKHLLSKEADAPLTIAEEELKEVKQLHLSAAAGGKAATLPGISFPMDDKAINELIRIAGKEISYVQLSIDVEKEMINLEKACDVDIHELPGMIPSDVPRYHFFIFNHTHEGDYLQSLVFIFSMPGYACSVKERMLYSSCKATLLSGCIDVLNMEIAKRLEISEGEDITEEFLQDELHPKKILHKPKFDKPKGPGGRGARRLIRKTADNNAEDE